MKTFTIRNNLRFVNCHFSGSLEAVKSLKFAAGLILVLSKGNIA